MIKEKLLLLPIDNTDPRESPAATMIIPAPEAQKLQAASSALKGTTTRWMSPDHWEKQDGWPTWLIKS